MNNINNLFIEIKNKNNSEVLKILEDAGINVADNYKRTALMNAALSNNVELVKMLIEKKAELDLQDKLGFTALHFAAQEAHTEVTKLLLENGADPNIGDKYGNTAAAVTYVNWKAGKNLDTMKMLILYKADLAIKNNAGRSVMSIMPDNLKQQLDIS